MLNEAQISLTGYVATQPVIKTFKSGVCNVTMRVAWTPRKQDLATGDWVDTNTSYVTVICWRRLATNAAICLRKGDPVVVKGRLSIRDYEDKQGRPRTNVEVEASSVGHDLTLGVSDFRRIRPQTGMTAAEYAAAQNAQAEAGAGAPGASLNGAAPEGLNGDGRNGSGLPHDEHGIPLPDPPDESESAFFDESAISDDEHVADPEPEAIAS